MGAAVWKRPENMGPTLPSGLVGLALTKPRLWFCPGVRLPGTQLSQVEEEVGACLWASGVFLLWKWGWGALSHDFAERKVNSRPEQTHGYGKLLQE